MLENYNYQTVYENRASYILYNVFRKIGKGKVIMPANICPIVPATIIKAGLTPHFIDIDPKELTMDGAILLETLKSEPHDFSGLIWVRTYGNNEPDLNPLIQSVKEYVPSLFFVDDQCLSVPLITVAKSEADLILYSTGYSKIAELGWGGYGFLASDFDYEKFPLDYQEAAHDEMQTIFREAIEQESKIKIPDTPWLDGRRPELSFDDYKMEVLRLSQKALAHKAKINAIYAEILPAEIQLDQSFQNWRFNILVKNKEQILKQIFEARLFASSHYAAVAPLYSPQNAPVAGELSGNIMNLFNDERFDEAMAEKTALIIKENL
jgi:hypothetical protein